MAVEVGVNSYGNEEGLEAYAEARGITINGDSTVLLIQAMDWLEIQPWYSRKYSESQNLEFPREITKYSDGVNETPLRIIIAQFVAALLIDSGEDLNGSIDRAIKTERVEGEVTVTYMDNAETKRRYPQLEQLINPYLSNTGGCFEVFR